MKIKFRTLFSMFSAVVVVCGAFAAVLWGAPLESRIAAVTVYLDRAVVTRTAAADLPAGETTVVFENLPAALMDESLSASGRGVPGSAILDVTALNVFTQAAPNERVKELEDQIKAFQKQRRVMDDRGKIIEQQRAFVERMLQASTAAAPAPSPAGIERAAAVRPSLDEWQKLYGYAEETFGKIAAEQQSLDNQREDLQAKQTVVESQLNELRGAQGRKAKTVRVRVSVPVAGRLEVSIQYAVPNAGWTPSYDARLRSADRAIDLSYFGVVRNGTGEEWKDVDLTLSTARPGLGGGAPELRAWITDVIVRPQMARFSGSLMNSAVSSGLNTVRDGLSTADTATRARNGQNQNNRGGGFGGGGGGFNNQFSLAVPIEAPKEVAAGVLDAEVEAGVTSATFKIPVKASVPGNSVTQKVGITTNRLPANLQFQSTPKALEAAFLNANAVNMSDYPMLAGPVNTFLDDTFVAAGTLKTVMPGEKFEVSLGVDDGITVKRRVVNRFSEDTGLTNKNRRVTYEVVVTVTNNKTTTEHLVFKEPTPVSQNEKIVVKLLTPSEKEVTAPKDPKEAAREKEVTREDDGKIVWRVNLKPGEKREFQLKLSVEYPGDVTVSGLE